MGIGRGFTLIGTSAGCVGAVAALMGLGVQQGSKKDAPPEFRAVDQGVGDRTGLSASYRDMGVDLRAPMNFDKVYRVEARSRLLQGMQGFEGGADARARGDGGCTPEELARAARRTALALCFRPSASTPVPGPTHSSAVPP